MTNDNRRSVLITGGGTGIGRAIALAFLDKGDAVTIVGRREAPLKDVAAGSSIDYQVADVTSEKDTEALFDKSFDVVVANAGMGSAGKIRDVSLDEWNNTLAVNLTGTFLTFRAALRSMDKYATDGSTASGGRLIAIASIASMQGNASIPAYSASKHGVLGLVRSVAKDVAKSGITCNAICPGYVDTEMAENGIEALRKRFGITRDEAIGMLVKGNPTQRLIDPTEVAATAVFLASDAAASINGHALSVTGGEI